MIAGTYLASATLTAVLAVLMVSGSLTRGSFIALVAVTFFFASAGASSAYLTVSEVFPMETRALAIALFFAIGTAVGGITGPALFGHFIHSGNVHLVAVGFFIGAGAMALGGVAELIFGVRAEQQSLENIARPLTAEEADGWPGGDRPAEPDAAGQERTDRIRRRGERHREDARTGAPRVRPGTGSSFYSPGMVGTAGTASRYAAAADVALDQEIELLAHVLDERGEIGLDELEQIVNGPSWGPRRFPRAVRAAVAEGRATRVSRRGYGPAGSRSRARDGDHRTA
jgi:MFS family permease